MSTFRIPILGWQTLPDDGGGQLFFELYTIKATNDNFKHGTWVFDSTGSTKLGLRGVFTVPKNYVSTPKAVVTWSSLTTSGNVVWDFDYRAIGGNDAESLDQATFQEALTVTDAAPTSAHLKLEVSLAMTAGNLAADDVVEFSLARDLSDAADTMNGFAAIHEAYFEFNDV